ncbi:uncharacterized protein LOC131332061 isoform X3 [Rhododendron vialii]|nr:uncharacterized protein LOC131332061 isoform X3 [Rhododendron vialii]XP_058222094.1 uncharacterized protein LOC131332061 isoform X3 [Rhododendron vialii]XP_058222095.1 uncharacterized protein LOC131332061 isoform X3 [Rhododendron vialii]XP_058222096.1 uncharacterized protein LOC131332061 isoform X3 [Rhododendron vialii]XP_058222097.1 uncharacterized protein LOC131332061 isoform X3 [Rhododendron vialii]XP_058222098.1 uncharacterized protein LOC131332061 isoform X3 [Rhododendron vialii]
MEQPQNPLRTNGGKRIVKKLMEEEVSGLELVQMNEETETTVDQILRQYRSKEGQSDRSHQFWDTLKILNSNRELNLILLQDPNPLLADCLQKLPKLQAEKEKCKSVRETKCRERGVINGRKSVEVVCTKKFQKENIYHSLWNKIRSLNGEQSTGRENPRTPSRIVDLKLRKGRTEISEIVNCHCSFVHSPHRLKNQGKSVKTSYFSFKGIKRKMRHAGADDRKEQHWISKDGSKGIGRKIASRNDKPSTDVKMKDTQSKIRLEIASPKESSHKKLSSSSVHFPKRRDFDIYLEARRHLSERLSHVEKDETFSAKKSPKTLDRILSSHQHDFLPIHSPDWVIQSSFVTSQMRFFPYSNFCGLQKEDKTSCLSSSTQDKGPSSFADNGKFDDQLHIFGSKPGNSENHSPDTEGHKSISSVTNDFSSNCYVKKAETNDDFKTMEDPTTASSRTCITSPRQSTDTANMSEEFGYLECSRPGSPSESQQLISSLDVSSPSPSSIQKLGFGDSIYDRIENPSPVSVLDPVFLKDITSPPSTTTKPVNAAANSTMQPLHVDFEEQYGYPNWDKLFLKWYSPDQLLSPSFFDELELPSLDSSCDQKLLFDYVNEVISEAYQCYFSCSPVPSFLKPKLQPIPVDKVVGHEIKKRVNLYLLLSPMAPRRLDEIVGEDLASSSTWMDIRRDIEVIAVHMVESILDELIPEALHEFHI